MGAAYSPVYTGGVTDTKNIFIDSVNIGGAEVNGQLALIVSLVVLAIIVTLALQFFGVIPRMLGMIRGFGGKK